MFINLKSIAKGKRQGDFYATVVHKNIPVGIMVDTDVHIQLFLCPDETSKAHHVLESKMLSTVFVINNCF